MKGNGFFQMTTYRHSDLESLIQDLSRINSVFDESEKQELIRELHLKISLKDLDKLSQLCYDYQYEYSKAFEIGEWV
jgi:hypothetical protein